MNAELLKQPDHFTSKLMLFCAAECNQEVSEEVRVVSIKWLLKHILEDKVIETFVYLKCEGYQEYDRSSFVKEVPQDLKAAWAQ